MEKLNPFLAIVGCKLQTKDGEKNTKDVIANKKVIGLYFSAHWCPPCRGFTPKLADFYKSMEEKFEVIFISSDRSQKDFDEYYKDMPWVAVSFSNRDIKEKLSDTYGIRGIPTLVLLDDKGETITKEGRQVVTNGEEEFRRVCKI